MNRIKAAQAFFEGIGVGGILLTVENTYRPELNGTRRQITKIRKSGYDAILLDDTAPYGSRGDIQTAGDACAGSIPTRAGDIVEVTDDTITTKLGDTERLAGHTVTMRRA